MAAGLSLLWFCDEMWLFGDTVTEGMAARAAVLQKSQDIRIRKIRENEIQQSVTRR